MAHEMGDTALFNVGVYIGRFNPLHRGHCQAINKMLFNHTDNHSILMIGSANASLGLRNLFTYEERRNFIKEIYPKLKIVPLGDQATDKTWFSSILDIVDAVFPFFHQVHLYCGALEDISSFNCEGRVIPEVVDRYAEQVYSATEVRRCIMMNNIPALVDLLPIDLVTPVYDLGRQRLEQLLRGEK
jgi:cytidyltransferase-like protein